MDVKCVYPTRTINLYPLLRSLIAISSILYFSARIILRRYLPITELLPREDIIIFVRTELRFGLLVRGDSWRDMTD